MRKINILTDIAVKNAKNTSNSVKPSGTKLNDGGGLYLYIQPTGTKVWRYDYAIAGKRKTLTLGVYPTLSLGEARKKHLQAKQKVSDGVDPAEEKQIQKQELAKQRDENALTFERVTQEWFDVVQGKNVERTQRTIKGRLNLHVFPVIGKTPIKKLTFDDCLKIVRGLERKKKYAMAIRIAGLLRQICRYAQARTYVPYNVADSITMVMEKRPDNNSKGLPAITDRDGVADMLRKIWKRAEVDGVSPYMATAMKLFCYLPQRAQEILKGTWDEVDLENGVWQIDGQRMKTRKKHSIPLCSQVVSLLQNLSNYRTSSPYMFPSGSKIGHLISDSVNKNMHVAGIPKGQMPLHGWRKVFSTLTHEAGCPSTLVEKCLAHASGDAVALAYNKAEYMEVRAVIMQWWADTVDALRLDETLPKLPLKQAEMFS